MQSSRYSHSTAPERAPLIFARTERGDALVRRNCRGLEPGAARLLLLMETPLTSEEVGAVFDEPWVPATLIELERHRLIERLHDLDGMAPAGPSTRPPALDDWPAVRERVRHAFEDLLGTLGDPMGRRIGQCESSDELDELMPQVEALVQAVAGHEALEHFLARTEMARS